MSAQKHSSRQQSISDVSSSTSDDTPSETKSWIEWYCSLSGHDFFLEVEHSFIADGFNLFGLRQKFPRYEEALQMIMSNEQPSGEILNKEEFLDTYYQAANLYALIHARYITTPRGLQKMKDKYLEGSFGYCPRVYCNGCHVLPVGIVDDPHEHRIRVYCPVCQEVYLPVRTPDEDEDPENEENLSYDVDGASFGSAFPHFFLQHFPTLVPTEIPKIYHPKVFGFRIYKGKSLIQLKLEAGEFGPSLAIKSDNPSSSTQQQSYSTTAHHGRPPLDMMMLVNHQQDSNTIVETNKQQDNQQKNNSRII